MGIGGNLPLAIASRLGLNGVVALQIGPTMSWADAMRPVVLEGMLICVLAATGLRQTIMHASVTAQASISVGIGLFIAFIGLVDSGFVTASSNTCFIKSAAGVGEGARTGLANLVTGGLFAVALFLTPLTTGVPTQAAMPAGGGRLPADDPSEEHPLGRLRDRHPGVPDMTLMPITYSITNGIGAGLVSYVLLAAVRGCWREPGILLWAIAGLFIVYFCGPHPAPGRFLTEQV